MTDVAMAAIAAASAAAVFTTLNGATARGDRSVATRTAALDARAAGADGAAATTATVFGLREIRRCRGNDQCNDP
jgi:hypothetical protein